MHQIAAFNPTKRSTNETALQPTVQTTTTLPKVTTASVVATKSKTLPSGQNEKPLSIVSRSLQTEELSSASPSIPILSNESTQVMIGSSGNRSSIEPTGSREAPVQNSAVASLSNDGMSTTTIILILSSILVGAGLVGTLLFAIFRSRPLEDDDDSDTCFDPRGTYRADHLKSDDFDMACISSIRTLGCGSEPAIMSMHSDIEQAISSIRSDIETAMSSIRSDPGNSPALTSMRLSRMSSSSSSAWNTGVGIAIRVPSLLDIRPEVYMAHPQLRQTMSQVRQDVLEMYTTREETTF